MDGNHHVSRFFKLRICEFSIQKNRDKNRLQHQDCKAYPFSVSRYITPKSWSQNKARGLKTHGQIDELCYKQQGII